MPAPQRPGSERGSRALTVQIRRALAGAQASPCRGPLGASVAQSVLRSRPQAGTGLEHRDQDGLCPELRWQDLWAALGQQLLQASPASIWKLTWVAGRRLRDTQQVSQKFGQTAPGVPCACDGGSVLKNKRIPGNTGSALRGTHLKWVV